MNNTTSNTVLSAQGLVKRFDGITATNNVTLDLQKGARHALIGPNGAGKTTLINLLTGVLEPTEGFITLEGQDITRLAPPQRVQRGMVRTFQINQLFDTLTPLETLALTVSQHQGLGGKWWQPLGARRAVTERCEQLLEQFHLTSVMTEETRVLAYGKRRLLEIAIALACVPAGEREELLQTVAVLPARAPPRGNGSPSACTRCSRGWPNARPTRVCSCRAASSRCWPWAARWCSTRACCCSTSRSKAWRPSSWKSCCAPSAASPARKASLPSSWSSIRRPSWPSPTALRCWTGARSCTPGRPTT